MQPKPSPLSTIKERTKEFKNSIPPTSASQDLLASSTALMILALQQRLTRHHPPDNIHTLHAPGAIILRMAAFESFLNETLGIIEFDPNAPKVKHLANTPFVDKYQSIFKLQTAITVPNTNDLDVAHHARNEVVHYLPRIRSGSKTLESLDQLGLLIPENFIGHGMESYNLALWVFHVTYRYANDLASALQNIPDAFFASNILSLAKNFEVPQSLKI